jgi:hypothetical protein
MVPSMGRDGHANKGELKYETQLYEGEGRIPTVICNMEILIKKVEDLRAADVEAFPVWEFVNNDEIGETAVRPVETIPVQTLRGRLVSVHVRLACGKTVLAQLGNVDSNNPKSTKHFLVLTVFHSGRNFTMARYHDFDWNRRGPQALADFLGLRVTDVFPISYDVSPFSTGDSAALAGKIEAEPTERLTRPEIFALAVKKRSAQ